MITEWIFFQKGKSLPVSINILYVSFTSEEPFCSEEPTSELAVVFTGPGQTIVTLIPFLFSCYQKKTNKQ